MTFQTGFWLALGASYVYLNIKQARVTWHVAKNLQAKGYFPKAPTPFLEWLTPAISFVLFSIVYATWTWAIDLIGGILTFSLFSTTTTAEMDEIVNEIHSKLE